jgi:hypothetical protein
MARAPRITSPYAPDLGEVRVWLERMIAALKFVELVAAILALIGRMRDANTELTKQLAGLRPKRPRSETLERLERQLLLPLEAITSVEKPKTAPLLPLNASPHWLATPPTSVAREGSSILSRCSPPCVPGSTSNEPLRRRKHRSEERSAICIGSGDG